MRFAHADAPLACRRSAQRLRKQIRKIHHTRLHSRNVEEFLSQHHRFVLGNFELDFFFIKCARTQLRAEIIASRTRRPFADEGVQHAILRIKMRLRLDLFVLALANHVDCRLEKVADDLFDIASDIADLGEFRCLNLQKRRVREAGQPARYFRLANSRRAYHQYVLRRDLLAQRLGQVPPPPAVAQRYRDRALRLHLPDDVTVKF